MQQLGSAAALPASARSTPQSAQRCCGEQTTPVQCDDDEEPSGGISRNAGVALAFSMASAVFTGTVDFSTTILELVDTEAIILAAPSQ